MKQFLKSKVLAASVSLVIAVVHNAHADDGHAATRSGSIVFEKTDEISMDQEYLEISRDRVNVKFQFKNLKNKPIKTLVAFPLPPLTCGYWAENHTLSDFTVKVDGKLVHPKRTMKAIENPTGGEEPVPFGTGKDITTRVKKAGLPIDCLKTWKDKSLFKKAQKNHLAQDYQGDDPEGVTYQTEITYSWEQVFPANSKVEIEHEYKPMSGIGLGYCPYDKDKLTFHLPVQSGPANCHLIDYVLRTAKTWSGPIGHFELSIPLQADDTEVWSNIGPMILNPTKTRAIFVKDSFVPEGDLVIGIWKKH
jgi:hypothetical protein